MQTSLLLIFPRAPPKETLACFRRAADRTISCRQHPQSSNKDLRLRNMYQTLFKEIIDPSLIEKDSPDH